MMSLGIGALGQAPTLAPTAEPIERSRVISELRPACRIVAKANVDLGAAGNGLHCDKPHAYLVRSRDDAAQILRSLYRLAVQSNFNGHCVVSLLGTRKRSGLRFRLLSRQLTKAAISRIEHLPTSWQDHQSGPLPLDLLQARDLSNPLRTCMTAEPL
jgi:hypothetical protein